MVASLKKRIISEIDSLPSNKANSLLDYILFLKFENDIKIPNEITEQTFKDTDNGKNIITCDNADDMFDKLGI